MNTELKHYIRNSFPEHSELTTLEIFIMINGSTLPKKQAAMVTQAED